MSIDERRPATGADGSMVDCRRRVLLLWPGTDRDKLARARDGMAAARLVARGTAESFEVVVALLGDACGIRPPQDRPALPSFDRPDRRRDVRSLRRRGS
jgi:hypothetical protein